MIFKGEDMAPKGKQVKIEDVMTTTEPEKKEEKVQETTPVENKTENEQKNETKSASKKSASLNKQKKKFNSPSPMSWHFLALDPTFHLCL